MNETDHSLRRALGIGAITVYAIGDVLGAGIYALVGQVAAAAGSAAWVSFLASASIALVTGLTYAEMSSRFPVAAGAAAYARRAFPHPSVSFLTGVFVLVSGITSAATVSRAFVGYLDPFVSLPALPASLAMLAIMTAINFVGIQESARVNFALTMIELGGLLLVLVVGLHFAMGAPAGTAAVRLAPSAGIDAVLTGATIAFFAYIGFEDTVNVAEEVKNPSRVLPRAILTAIGFTTVIYAGIAIVALMTVPLDRLATSSAPLLEVFDAAGVPISTEAFSIVALFAICNTGLLNLIMASRLSYGMAREGLLPAALAKVHPRRRTPWVAVLAAFVLAALLAASGGVQVLAQTTSLLLLSVFTLLHAALVVVKRRFPVVDADTFVTPAWTPVLGCLLCAGLALRYPFEVYFRAGVVLAVGVLLYALFGRALTRGGSPQA